MTKIEQAAREFEVPDGALPPRNRGEQRRMMESKRGRYAGFLAGAKHVLERARAIKFESYAWDKAYYGDAVKIADLESLFEEQGK